MPKKFKGTNSKAEEARARKDAARLAEKERKQKEEEDRYWEDNDKHVMRKQQRKVGSCLQDDKERKRQEATERKVANQEALKAEESESSKSGPSVRPKMTVAEIQAERERKAAAAASATAKTKKADEETRDVLEENPNQQMAALMAAEGSVEARSVEDAIAVLNVSKTTPTDRHPEKRMKAAYNAFEERELPKLKTENPNMRLSQIKQLLKKEWMKSPENPMNMVYAKRTQQFIHSEFIIGNITKSVCCGHLTLSVA